MAGGQAITSGIGTVVANGADNNFAVTGSAFTSAVGDVAKNRFHPLRSRKVGGGTATTALTGSSMTSASGTTGVRRFYQLVGYAMSVLTGTLTYQGMALLAWNANPEPDVIGYRIYHGNTLPGEYFETVNVGNVTSYAFGGLNATGSVTHFFAVTAVDLAGQESGKSAEVSKVY